MLFTSFQNLNFLCSNIFPLYCFNRSELLSGFLHSITAQSAFNPSYTVFSTSKNIVIFCFFSNKKKQPSFFERLCGMSKLFKD